MHELGAGSLGLAVIAPGQEAVRRFVQLGGAGGQVVALARETGQVGLQRADGIVKLSQSITGVANINVDDRQALFAHGLVDQIVQRTLD